MEERKFESEIGYESMAIGPIKFIIKSLPIKKNESYLMKLQVFS